MSKIETLQPDRLEQQVGPRTSLIKPILPEVDGDLPNEDRTKQLVDRMVVIIWANQVFAEYAECNGLSEQNSRERKHAKNLITQTAAQLLENPQDISIAERAWRTNEAEQDGAKEPQEPFSKKVKEKMLTIIRDKKEGVTPEQFTGLVRIYGNKDEPQNSTREFAGNLLRIYLNSPKKSRNQRIDAYYNFVSGVLDLADEDKVFRDGMKIALHATDILPKDPSFVEQAVLVSLPHKEDGVFQKAIIANYIIYQLRFMGLQDFKRYYDDRGAFAKGIAVKQEMRKKVHRVTKEIGLDETRKLNRATESFLYTIIEPLSGERKQALMGTWPFNLAFDGNDPLNQKFKKVFSDQLSRSSQVPS